MGKYKCNERRDIMTIRNKTQLLYALLLFI